MTSSVKCVSFNLNECLFTELFISLFLSVYRSIYGDIDLFRYRYRCRYISLCILHPRSMRSRMQQCFRKTGQAPKLDS